MAIQSSGPAAPSLEKSSARRRFRRSFRLLNAPLLSGSILILALIGLMAWIGPLLGPDASLINLDYPAAGLGVGGHWLGTDDLGRDLFTRVAIGARISLSIGLLTALVSVWVGGLYGILSATFEGRVDRLMMRVVDVLYCLPGLMVVILLSVFLEPILRALEPMLPILAGTGVVRIVAIVLALSFFSWPDTARIIRGQVLALKREEYIEAFHSLGGRLPRLIGRHFLPNLGALLILTATITVPRAILTESTLSFIGLGVEAPMSSWGTLASDGWQLVRVAPHMLLVPGTFILVTMLALNLLGDALRRQINPKNQG
jgi:oligopeptide transport system permease protein